MRLLHGVAFGIGIVCITAAGWVFYQRRADSTVGQRAPTREMSSSRIGSISARNLGKGPIVSIVPHGQRLLLLQNHSWSWVDASHAEGPFGSSVRGEPGYFAIGSAIAADDSIVYILDSAARMVQEFRLSGDWVRSRRIPDAAGITPADLVVTRGKIFISAYETTTRTWLVLALTDSIQSVTILSRRSSALHPLLIAADSSSGVIALATDTYEIIDTRGASVLRSNPPLVGIPASTRRMLLQYSAQVRNADPAMLVPPKHLPIARMFVVSPTAFTVAVTTSPDDYLVETISRTGVPASTLAVRVEPPFALLESGYITCVDSADETEFFLYHPRATHVDSN